MSSPASINFPARPLNSGDYKTLALSSLGGTLEFYDFVAFVFFSVTLGHLFFPPTMPEWMVQLQTLAIFAAGYLARPIGGIVIAHFGDKFGRKKMFTFSIFLMAVPTLAIGLLPTFEAIGIAAPLLLLLMRVLQGAAIGGEMPGAWVFIAEHVPASRIGLGIGVLTSSICGGILLGSLMAIFINRTFSSAEILDYAWRIPFILGGVFGLLSVYLRRFLSETPIFKELEAQREVNKELPVKTVIREHRLGGGILAGLTWSLSTAILVVVLMTPTVILQKVYKIAPTVALEANCVATLMLVIGCIVFGLMNDRIGTKSTLLVSFGGLLLSSYYFYSSLQSHGAENLMLNYAIVGFFTGAITMTPIVGVRVFPAAVRFTGLSFYYNIAYAIFGGITPVLTQVWLQNDRMGPAYYVGFVSLLAIVLAFIPMTSKGWTATTAAA